ncbi:MAG: SDR family NAD(P)-dependent oxidoreductase [Acidobacteria bacterium]|nr:SDR family NAD(P)-dependent oxidoreductase [Acidobacteriota bacterium]
MFDTFDRALVIGASSGIGEALARRLAAGGTRLALVARRESELARIAGEINGAAGEERALVFVHDVLDRDEPPLLLQRIAAALGGLDLVIYAAGVLYRPAPDEFDTGKDLHVIEVNLLGAIAWLDPVAERFSRLGRGTIVGIGSIAGDRGRAAAPAYNTSKAALATYLEALRNRVSRAGVTVVTVKPGFVRTPMTAGLGKLPGAISAERAAALILKRASRRAATAYIPARWRFVSLAVRAVPSWLFRRLSV